MSDAVITIPFNNGSDGTFNFNLTGTGSATAVPDINVDIGGSYYASGSTLSTGSVVLSSSSAVYTFTVRNDGAANLNLTGSPLVLTGGANPADFIVTQPSLSSIGAGGSDTFTVVFTPTAVGTRSATLTIPSDDPDVGSYVICLTGTCAPVPSRISVSVSSRPITRQALPPMPSVRLLSAPRSRSHSQYRTWAPRP